MQCSTSGDGDDIPGKWVAHGASSAKRLHGRVRRPRRAPLSGRPCCPRRAQVAKRGSNSSVKGSVRFDRATYYVPLYIFIETKEPPPPCVEARRYHNSHLPSAHDLHMSIESRTPAAAAPRPPHLPFITPAHPRTSFYRFTHPGPTLPFPALPCPNQSQALFPSHL